LVSRELAGSGDPALHIQLHRSGLEGGRPPRPPRQESAVPNGGARRLNGNAPPASIVAIAHDLARSLAIRARDQFGAAAGRTDRGSPANLGYQLKLTFIDDAAALALRTVDGTFAVTTGTRGHRCSFDCSSPRP